MATGTTSGGTSTQIVTKEQRPEEHLVLHLHKPKTDKKVQWQEGTVDNEFMGKKTSKCCCIYNKPYKFGESDTESDSDDDGDCCHEHKVARRKIPHKHDENPPQESGN